ncbi:hypothetical protein ASF44_22340 [Pseudorhodoferax sp. Leaf274]|nr:hypothetical protein ASF44_22340 [Pseudorhodoferax sp. Leaf274]
MRALETTEPLVYEDRFDEGFAATGLPDELAPLLRPADVMDPQPATNVMLPGHAQIPSSAADSGVKDFESWLGVGAAVFPMRVHRPRQWRSRWFVTRLLSLFLSRRFKAVGQGRVTRRPLAWQQAYGGADRFGGRADAQHWPFNPAGQGFHVDPRAATIQGLALPAIEDPRQRIKQWQDRRTPQIPGALNPLWAPRVDHGGTRDARWRATRAPARPRDGTAHFHNTAHPDLQFSPHLKGGEPVRAQGFTDDGQALFFELPDLAPQLHSYHYGEFAAHALPLNTVLIDADRRQVTLLFRAFVPDVHRGNALRSLMLGSRDHPVELKP